MRTAPLLLSLVLLPSVAAGVPLREDVELALSDLERVPDKKELLELSPQVEQILQDLVEHPSRRALARSRAIAVLQFFPSTQTRATIRGVIQAGSKATRGLALLDLQTALTSYAVIEGPSSLPVLRPFLSHASIDVRSAAVRAVFLSGHANRRAILEARHAVEPSATVRARIAGELKRLTR